MNGETLPLGETIDLVAHDAVRNIRRRYALELTTDLFGAYILDLRWGRIGTRGQAKRLSFADRAEAERHAAAVLRRRDTAEARIGVPYVRMNGLMRDK